MESVVEPAPVVMVQLLAPYGACGRTVVDRRGDRERVEEDARRIGRRAELGAGEPCGDVLGEAGAEGEDAIGMADAEGAGAGFDFGAEFHGAKIRTPRRKMACGGENISRFRFSLLSLCL